MLRYEYSLFPFCIILLQACGGSSGDDIASNSAAANAANIYVSDRIQNEEVFETNLLSSLKLNYDTDTVAASLPGQLNFERKSNGIYTVLLNGEEYTVTDDDRYINNDGRVYGLWVYNEDTREYIYLWNQTNILDELVYSGEKYVNIIGIQVDGGIDNRGVHDRSIAAIGVPSSVQDLAAAATAQYTGIAQFHVFPRTGFSQVSQSMTRVRGNLTMDADYGSGRISGEIVDLTRELPQQDARLYVDGSVSLNETSMNGTQFSGTVSVNSTDFVEASAGTYSGGVFGPNADEVGGVVSLESDTAVSQGYFVGTRVSASSTSPKAN